MAAGGTAGYLRTRSTPSLVAGIGLGISYAYAGTLTMLMLQFSFLSRGNRRRRGSQRKKERNVYNLDFPARQPFPAQEKIEINQDFGITIVFLLT